MHLYTSVLAMRTIQQSVDANHLKLFIERESRNILKTWPRFVLYLLKRDGIPHLLKISRAAFHSLETPELLPVDLQYVCPCVCLCVHIRVR